MGYFQRNEFRCNHGGCSFCGGVSPVAPSLIDVCTYLREKVKVPLLVNSGFRCTQHNIKVNGAANSFHKKGLAADLTTKDPVDLYKLHTYAAHDKKIRELCGLILYKDFLHIDVRTKDPFEPKLPYYQDRR